MTLVESSKTKYLEFTKYLPKDKKTFIVEIHNKSDLYLGSIRWMPLWRRYAYLTVDGIYLDKTCMDEISNYINTMMNTRVIIPPRTNGNPTTFKAVVDDLTKRGIIKDK